MKSRITIEIDFENNNEPFIQVVNNHQSPDVRDKLLTNFRQSLLGSPWLKVEYPHFCEDSDSVMMTIRAIKPSELVSEAWKMHEKDKANTHDI